MLSPRSRRVANLTISPSGDEDWLTFANTCITFGTTITLSSADDPNIQFDMVDANGNAIPSESNTTNFTTLIGGTYELVVYDPTAAWATTSSRSPTRQGPGRHRFRLRVCGLAGRTEDGRPTPGTPKDRPGSSVDEFGRPRFTSALHARLPSTRVTEGVVIRPEREADHPAIADVVRAAFVRHPDEVAELVERIRESEHFVPELALVAEDSSGVIAHVMLSWVGVEGGSRPRILNLSPMSVRPDRQRAGVGTRLIRDALCRAEEAGEPAVFVEGIPGYYPRFGFEQASTLGYVSPDPTIPDEAFMVKRLPGFSPDLAGRIVYPAAFDVVA